MHNYMHNIYDFNETAQMEEHKLMMSDTIKFDS